MKLLTPEDLIRDMLEESSYSYDQVTWNRNMDFYFGFDIFFDGKRVFHTHAFLEEPPQTAEQESLIIENMIRANREVRGKRAKGLTGEAPKSKPARNLRDILEDHS